MSDQTIVVVTGGNRGIGREVCRQLAEHGCRVVLTARDVRDADNAAHELASSGHVQAHPLDVTDDDQVRQLGSWLEAEVGRVDVLVNNAAIDYDTGARASAADLADVHRAFDTNLFGAWRVTLGLLPLLRRSAHPRIVNVSSEAGAISEMTGGTPAYATSKAALNALTRLLAGELDGFLVNAVCPGWTATDMGGGGRPVAEGAASVVWAALLDPDGPTGTFTRDGHTIPW